MPIARQAPSGTPGTCRPCRGRRRWSPARSPAARRRAPAAGRSAVSRRCGSTDRDIRSASGPARPHRLRGQRAGQQQRRVHRLGRRPQHRGGDGPGRDGRSSRSARRGRSCRCPARPARPAGWSRSASTRPGRTAVTVPNGPSGRLASDRRVRADPKVCLPAETPRHQPVERRPGRHHRRPGRPRARRPGSAPRAAAAGRRCPSTGPSPRATAWRTASTTRSSARRPRGLPGEPVIDQPPARRASHSGSRSRCNVLSGTSCPAAGSSADLRHLPLPQRARPPGRTRASAGIPAAASGGTAR